MSDTSTASVKKILPERSETNTTTEGRKPQLSALLSEIFAVSANEQCKTAGYTGKRTVQEWKRRYKAYLAPNSS